MPPGARRFRNACYGVASGAYDVVMAVGVEKLKDGGFSGLVGTAPPNDGTDAPLTAPAMFSLLAPAYAERYGLDHDQMADVLSRIAWKNHVNGARNPRAQFQKEVPIETIKSSPRIAGQLGVFDCSGVSDGAAAAVIVRAEDAHRYTDKPLYVKALSFVAGPGTGPMDCEYDYTTFEEVVRSSADAYAQAGVQDPRAELALAEVHDCFTPTELVLMEDLGFSPRGSAWRDVLAGGFDRDGDLPVNPDGGLKSFRAPDRGERPADAVRVLAAAPWRGSSGASAGHRRRRTDARAHPQPWRSARCLRELRQHRGQRAIGLMADAGKVVRVTDADRVRTITLDRPEVRNALDEEVLEQLEDVLQETARWSGHVVVLEGAGTVFSAGADLNAVHTRHERWSDARSHAWRWNRLVDHLEELPQVTIARLHGHVVGGGLVLALGCDLRVAQHGTRFKVPELALGVSFAMGGVTRLVREIGLAHAREVILTGRTLTAEELLVAGLVHRIGEVDEELAVLLSELGAAPDGLLHATKHALRSIGRMLSPVDLAWADHELLSYARDRRDA